MKVNDLRQNIHSLLNLENNSKNKSKTKKIINAMREILDDVNVLDKAQLYSYRKKGEVPAAMLQGFALGLLFAEQKKRSGPMDSYKKIAFFNAFKISGLYFDKITKFYRIVIPEGLAMNMS